MSTKCWNASISKKDFVHEKQLYLSTTNLVLYAFGKSRVHLHVVLHKASDLIASDSIAEGGKSDPYVIFTIGKMQLKSSVISTCLDPKWVHNEDFWFVIEPEEANHAVLQVQVMDRDLLSADDPLGYVNIPLAKAIHWNNEMKGYHLNFTNDMKVPKNVKSQIYLTLSFLDEHAFALKDVVREWKAVDKVWQNEIWRPGKGWSAENMGAQYMLKWSSIDDSVTADIFGDVAPPVPDGWEAEGWAYSLEQGDEEGWIYAKSFKGPWEKHASALTVVRRRMWENRRRCTNPAAYVSDQLGNQEEL